MRIAVKSFTLISLKLWIASDADKNSLCGSSRLIDAWDLLASQDNSVQVRVSEMKRRAAIYTARDVSVALTFFTVLVNVPGEFAHANPYLAKAGETVIKARVGTCAVTGGFIHLYAALNNRIFDKYGINAGARRASRRRCGHGRAGVGRNPVSLLQR